MTTLTDQAVTVEVEAGVATVSFNRPERLNALGSDLSTGLLDALDQVAADDQVRAVVLTGRGRGFCAGADLKNPNTHRTDDLEASMDRTPRLGMFDVLSAFPKPVVAAVNGYAIGAGCLLTLCCDFIYAAETAQFQLPQVKLGIMPAYGGSLRLARVIGSLNTAEMILTGRMVGAREAAAWGMVTRVLPPDDLLPAAQETMRLIASHPPVAVRLARESLRQGIESGNMHATETADVHRLMLLTTRNDTARQHQAWRDNRGSARRGD